MASSLFPQNTPGGQTAVPNPFALAVAYSNYVRYWNLMRLAAEQQAAQAATENREKAAKLSPKSGSVSPGGQKSCSPSTQVDFHHLGACFEAETTKEQPVVPTAIRPQAFLNW